MNYNILTEPFIPISDGRYVSLLFCLEHAHELQRISCSTPLETYAAYRFLCAFHLSYLYIGFRFLFSFNLFLFCCDSNLFTYSIIC